MAQILMNCKRYVGRGSKGDNVVIVIGKGLRIGKKECSTICIVIVRV